MHLFDSHCHFDVSEFDLRRETLWASCYTAGVKQLLIPGVAPKQWSKAEALAYQYEGVVMSAGLHPWWLDKAQLPTESEWRETLQKRCCVAVGECGLDAAIDIPLNKQQAIFEQHLEMAKISALPIIIHVRQTHNETIRLLKKYQLPQGGVIHGFTGSKEIAMQYWQMGFYLGVGGSITYSRANKTRRAIQVMPLESLLLETDAPDMPLQGYQGQANSPLRLVEVANTLAILKSETLEHIAQQTTKNSQRLFGLA